jgi:2-octaprenyl-6-methoxyphenol hydroxylase
MTNQIIGQETELSVDVLIVGGGLVGRVLAHALVQNALSVVLVDKDHPHDQVRPEIDGRTTAVSYGSKQFLNSLGLWDSIAPYAEPILDIRVFEHGFSWTVDYTHKDLGNDPMGYIVENQYLRQSFHKEDTTGLLHVFAPRTLQSHTVTETGVEAQLSCGQQIRASLIVGAEGRFSPTRSKSSIRTKMWDYDQTVLVAHVLHEKPHQGTAWEVFFPEGPLAFLPMQNCPQTNGFQSGIVWAKGRNYGWDTFSNAQLEAELMKVFPFYGALTLNSKRWTYNLTGLHVSSAVDKRFALVGDAAHVLHPIAGQGVNVGWRDVASLAPLLGRAKKLGLDVGGFETLQVYARHRKKDHAFALGITDGIFRLFSNNSSILSLVRNAGFAAVNTIPFLKRYLMKKAMGV